MTTISRDATTPAAVARRLALGLTLLLGVALLASVAPGLPALAERIGMPFQIDPSEGVIAGESRLLLDGVNVWAPVQPDLFTAAPYPPLFYLLLLPALAAGLPPFAAARALTVAATLGLAVGAGVLVARRTGQPAAGVVTAGLWLAPNLVAVWAVRARPDLLALLMNLAGLALIWWADERTPAAGSTTGAPPTWPRQLSDLARPVVEPALVVAAALFALGFFFKHTALAAPAAAGLFLLMRRPRAAAGFGLAYATAVLGPYLMLDWLSDGGVTQHLITFHRSWLWRNYLELALPFLRHYWLLLLLPLTAAVLDLWMRRRPGLPTLYLATAALVSLGGGTHGGNHNHLLEVLLALALAAGVGLGRALDGRLAVPALSLAGLATLALLLEPAGGQAWLTGDLRPPSAAEQRGWQQVTTVVEGDAGPVYSDNVGALAVTGHAIWVTDPFTMAASVEAGLWSDAALVGAVRRREFSLIALRYDVNRLRGVPTDITPDLLAAVREHYDVAERNVLFLYRPKAGG
ncbi:MAG: hypothetical protein IT340_09255 [Chloroflexi bacterium]|nr:hypothetical protein [Chloroflexota bacterium]